jgi:hypothetical protein
MVISFINFITPRWLPHPRRIYLTPLVWPPTKEYANAHIFVEVIENDWKNDRKASIGLQFSHEPFINALSSILLYEKRSLAVLHFNATSSDNKLDYLATTQAIEESALWKKLTTIVVPYDNSSIYLYKRATD